MGSDWGGIVDSVKWRFYKNALRMPRNAANGAADSQVGRDSVKGKVLRAATKYWVRVKQKVKEEPVRQCYGWQVGQQRVECWKRRLGKKWILLNWATYCKTRDRQT